MSQEIKASWGWDGADGAGRGDRATPGTPPEGTDVTDLDVTPESGPAPSHGPRIRTWTRSGTPRGRRALTAAVVALLAVVGATPSLRTGVADRVSDLAAPRRL